MPGTVSVAMNCLNGQDYLREALDSVFAQTYDRWHIVFWDNASTDRTAEIVQSYGPRVHYYRGEKTIPLGAARNQVLLLCSGQYVAFLDVDDVWLPTKLERQVAAMAANPRAGLVYTDVVFVDREVGNRICLLSDKHHLFQGSCFYDLVPGNYISPSMAMLRRRAVEQVGLFNESYEFVEESDYFLRIARDYELVCIPEPLTVYRYHEGNESNKFAAQQAEAERFQAALLRDYPDIARELPGLARQWRFHNASRRFRWHLGRRETGPAVRWLAATLGAAAVIPGYSLKRMEAYAARLLGLRSTADWLR